jgi:hypothetical protein
MQVFSQHYPSRMDDYHPLSHLYWVRPVQVVWATEGVVQYVNLKPFQTTAATLLLSGLVQAANGVHITEQHQLQRLGPGRAPGTLVQLWKAFRAFRTEALARGATESQIERDWSATFSQASRPHFTTYHQPGAVHFYAPDVVGGVIGGMLAMMCIWL